MTLREYLGTMTEPELRAALEILAASSPAVVAQALAQALAQAVKGVRVRPVIRGEVISSHCDTTPDDHAIAVIPAQG